MPKLPHISGAEAVRLFEKLGFIVKQQSGSHIVMRRGSSGCVIPNHKELKTGTLSGILRQAGVTPDEFIEVLNK